MNLSFETILPLIVFLSITMGIWAILSAIADRPANADERLRRIMNPEHDRKAKEEQVVGRQEKFQAQVTRAANKLGQSLRPTDEAGLGKVRLKLLNAGFRNENSVAVFYGIKMILMLICMCVAFPLLALRYGMTRNALTYTALVAAIGFYLPGMVVDNYKKKRSESIFLGLPDALDLMVVCVEAGLGLDAAMSA